MILESVLNLSKPSKINGFNNYLVDYGEFIVNKE